jgi:hypothetical protein
VPAAVNKNAIGESHSWGGNGAATKGGNAMCDKCDELDKKIEHYRRLARQITDRQFNERALILIAELEGNKKTLHPEQQ